MPELTHGSIMLSSAAIYRRLLLLVDANIVCVLLSASGRAVSGQPHRLAVSGEFNVPMNGDRSTSAGILLNRVLIDAFE